ncbi:hypothetical protein FDI40_gp499 [Agrobacterium phage Atu_ph07]|uniref:YjiS-like domain-containing protein n=1 Tax=Agrobacterium phage Atu_ph07 TaxID=2024264 RepID=A0A2L0V0D8_9CAUD|nr:hypothetical protein FDI40_gp499 [Agrobacterium phage Atu_ph07]AUZ95258.1 hypothetical protein [Agrobacterium phage Atu_ph07]
MLISTIKRWNAYRKTTTELSRLSDESLKDIGVSRSEIHHLARNGRLV